MFRQPKDSSRKKTVLVRVCPPQHTAALGQVLFVSLLRPRGFSAFDWRARQEVAVIPRSPPCFLLPPRFRLSSRGRVRRKAHSSGCPESRLSGPSCRGDTKRGLLHPATRRCTTGGKRGTKASRQKAKSKGRFVTQTILSSTTTVDKSEPAYTGGGGGGKRATL